MCTSLFASTCNASNLPSQAQYHNTVLHRQNARLLLFLKLQHNSSKYACKCCTIRTAGIYKHADFGLINQLCTISSFNFPSYSIAIMTYSCCHILSCSINRKKNKDKYYKYHCMLSRKMVCNMDACAFPHSVGVSNSLYFFSFHITMSKCMQQAKHPNEIHIAAF